MRSCIGREQAPFWSLEEFLGAYRSPDSGEQQELFAAYDGDRMVANATLWTPLLDNTDKAFFELSVDLPDRRRGHRPRAWSRSSSSSSGTTAALWS